jgi:hypothetical protein
MVDATVIGTAAATVGTLATITTVSALIAHIPGLLSRPLVRKVAFLTMNVLAPLLVFNGIGEKLKTDEVSEAFVVLMWGFANIVLAGIVVSMVVGSASAFVTLICALLCYAGFCKQ